MIKSVWLAGLATVTVLTLACGGPTPPAPTPTPLGSPPAEGSPGASPGPSVDLGGSFSPVDLGAVADHPPQPMLPGLYLPAGTLAQGTDHYALIQARMDCPTLTAVLGAGQWAVTDEAHLTIPTPRPGETAQPMPNLTLPSWLLLHWGDESAVARVGGDENGCLAQVWRLPSIDYAMHGAIESAGQATALQVECVVGAGMAELGFFYFADDGTLYSLSTTVPLKVGSHAVPVETEVYAGSGIGITVDQMFPVLYGGEPEPSDGPRGEPYAPADPEGGWQGSVEIAGTDPLVGQITLDDMRNAADERLSLTTGFRCELRPGVLSRAAEEAANASPTPAPSPSPAPGEVTIKIASGAHAGTHHALSAEATCSLGLFRGGRWTVTYGASEPVQGELQTLTLDLPADGGKSNVQMIFGDDFDKDWFSDDNANATVDDQGTSVAFTVAGHASGTDFTIDFVCNDVARF